MRTNSIAGRVQGFLVGTLLINLAGAAACWVIATKYLGTSGFAGLWGMGAVIGFLMASTQSLHLFAPNKTGEGFLAQAGTAFMGLVMIGWMLGVALSMFAEDSESLMADAKTIATHVWRGIESLLS
ncbi:MAG: hypothetical protein V3W41_01640 [Planctomycetota bacterium]